jgi:hypothetical protein
MKDVKADSQCSLQTAFSIMRLQNSDRPIIIPPMAEAAVPSTDMPPLVPGGTRFHVVMRIGGVFERIPSSEARVSPKQQLKCLQKVEELNGKALS